MRNGREDWDTTYHFLMSLWEPINRLPEHSQMFLRMKIQEMIFQEIQKQKGPKVAPVHLKCSSFITRMEDRIKEKEANTWRPNHFFLTFSEWQLCYIRSYLFFHYLTSHTFCGFLIITLFRVHDDYGTFNWTDKHTVIITSNIILNILCNYGPVLQFLSYLIVTMTAPQG